MVELYIVLLTIFSINNILNQNNKYINMDPPSSLSRKGGTIFTTISTSEQYGGRW